jgi:hypothetical protein
MGVIDHVWILFVLSRELPVRARWRPLPSWPFAAWIEVLAQALPAIKVVVLQLLKIGRIFRHPLREMGFEHEGHGIGQLHGLELAVAGMLEG